MEYKLIIKKIKQKAILTDEQKQARRENAKARREANKDKPKKEKKPKVDTSEQDELIKEQIKKTFGLSLDEINEKLQKPVNTVQMGLPVSTETKKVKKSKK